MVREGGFQPQFCMPRPAPLPDPYASEPFAIHAALKEGVTARRLRNGDLARPFHGVRAPSRPRDLRDLARTYAARMLPHEAFTHLTAAYLQGLRLPEGYRSTTLDASFLAPHRAPRAAGTRGRQISADTELIVLPDGLRTTPPITTWLHCSELLAVDDLIVMGDGLLRRRHPLATLDQLKAAVDAYAPRRGVSKLREALVWVRTDTDSARETMLRLIVVRAGFPEPKVNWPIVNRFGATIAHGDLVFPEYRVVLEYDGRQHAEDETQFAIDIDRLDELMEENWRVIRVDKSLMRRRATLLGKINTALTAGGWNPRP